MEFDTHSRGYSSSDGGHRLRAGSSSSAIAIPAHVTRLTGRPKFDEIFKGKGSPLREGGDVIVCGKLHLA